MVKILGKMIWRQFLKIEAMQLSRDKIVTCTHYAHPITLKGVNKSHKFSGIAVFP